MADNKKDEKATSPAPHAVATEVSTNPDEYSTGPAGVDPDAEPAPKTYYLREGASHLHIEKGEPRELSQFGQKATLTASQYDAFKDKFLTEAEYKAAKAGKDALAEGASAPLDAQTSEVATVEEHTAAVAGNEGAAHDENKKK